MQMDVCLKIDEPKKIMSKLFQKNSGSYLVRGILTCRVKNRRKQVPAPREKGRKVKNGMDEESI